MKIDGGLNYNSYLQYLKPLEIRDVADVSLNATKEDAGDKKEKKDPEASAEYIRSDSAAVVQKPVVRESEPAGEGRVVSRAETFMETLSHKAKSTLPLEDISVNFDADSPGDVLTTGYSAGELHKAISDMEKDSVLHEYQYFIGSGGPERLVDDTDGVVIKMQRPSVA